MLAVSFEPTTAAGDAAMSIALMTHRRMVVAVLLGLLAGACTAGGTGSGTAAVVTGTATYRERILLPPEAVFEAVLQDVSRADAPALGIGRTRIDNPGAPPIAFAIAYDPAAIDPRMTYAVRAVIAVGGRLMFTSESLTPVLTRGAPAEVSILMRMVGRQPAP
jgi:putative lipoprotein